MTLAQFLRLATDRLQQAGIDNPSLDARWLFCHALNNDRAQLLSQSQRILTTGEQAQIDALITRRAAHEPVARIIGAREFWGLRFSLNEATLEPRPDSETVVEVVLKILDASDLRGKKLRLLDLGTGTGCLLLSLLHEQPSATGIGIDIAPRAVEQARQNAQALELQTRASFHVDDWFAGLRAGDSTKNTIPKFDVIVSNPPYIPASDIANLMPEVRNHDPLRALDGGADGRDPYRHLIPQLKDFLNPKGLVVFEVGIDQAHDVAALLETHAFINIHLYKDLGGIERCVSAHIS